MKKYECLIDTLYFKKCDIFYESGVYDKERNTQILISDTNDLLIFQNQVEKNVNFKQIN